MLNIAKRQILPAVVNYSRQVAKAVKTVSESGAKSQAHNALLLKVCDLINSMQQAIGALESALGKAGKIAEISKRAKEYRDSVIPAMQELRRFADELEMIVDADLWPLPTYAEMLFLR